MATQRNYSAVEAQQRFKTLPPEIQDMLYSQEMQTALITVGEKHKLHLDQLGGLEFETTAVMLGFTEPDDFPPILVERLKITSEEATTIAKDIDDLLFIKIRAAMKSPEAMGSLLQRSPSTTAPTTSLQQNKGVGVATLPVMSPSTWSSPLSETVIKTLPDSPQHNSSVPTTNKMVLPENKPLKTDPYREPVE